MKGLICAPPEPDRWRRTSCSWPSRRPPRTGWPGRWSHWRWSARNSHNARPCRRCWWSRLPPCVKVLGRWNVGSVVVIAPLKSRQPGVGVAVLLGVSVGVTGVFVGRIRRGVARRIRRGDRRVRGVLVGVLLGVFVGGTGVFGRIGWGVARRIRSAVGRRVRRGIGWGVARRIASAGPGCWFACGSAGRACCSAG